MIKKLIKCLKKVFSKKIVLSGKELNTFFKELTKKQIIREIIYDTKIYFPDKEITKKEKQKFKKYSKNKLLKIMLSLKAKPIKRGKK